MTQKNSLRFMKRIVLFVVLPMLVIYLLLVGWLGRPEQRILDNGGCIRFHTNERTEHITKYRHYRFEKCMAYQGFGVNVSMYDSQTNEKIFSKTVMTSFNNLGFMFSTPIDCRVTKSKNDPFEFCEFAMNYSNWYGAYREFGYETPRYYLNPPHEREYTEPEF